MTECVVRMKTPSCCYKCPLRIACVLYKKWLANEADMPCVYDDGCLIICSLPEGHGRLVDADELESRCRPVKNFENQDGLVIGVGPLRCSKTIVPATEGGSHE